jgi:hypothetical protein
MRIDFRQDLRRNADIDHVDRARMRASREQHMRRLLGVEGRSPRSADRGSHHSAGIGVDPAWDVDGERGRCIGVRSLDDRPRRTFQRAFQPGSEQGVDDEASALEYRRRQRLDRPAIEPGHQLRVARQRGLPAKESEADGPACVGEMARGHEAVAAIVAGPAYHGDRPALPEPFGDRGDAFAGALHHRGFRDPARGGDVFCPRRLSGGEDEG